MTETQTILYPNELRVGNWVNLEGIGPLRWDWWNFEEYVKDQRDGYGLSHLKTSAVISDKIEPIPLTPEILENAGFEKQIQMLDEERISNIWFLTKRTNLFGGRHLRIRLLRSGKTFIKWNGYENRLVDPNHIKYVHQLQNLYHSLTGKELEINL